MIHKLVQILQEHKPVHLQQELQNANFLTEPIIPVTLH